MRNAGAKLQRTRRTRRVSPPRPEGLALRPGTLADAAQLHRLINANLVTGHLLPRTLDDLTIHASRFVIVTDHQRIVGCAELAPLSSKLAEIRSLVVDEPYRGSGLSRRLVYQLTRRARLDGYAQLCAFTHQPEFFVRLGFSMIPHTWVPEKIATDCHTCALFRRCGQHAMVLSLCRVPAGVLQPSTFLEAGSSASWSSQ